MKTKTGTRPPHWLALVAAAVLLAACGKAEDWPEDMAPIRWDRDTCAQCSMAISDHRFAVELRGGPGNAAFKFDDIGCLSAWLSEKTAASQVWVDSPDTRIWAADFNSSSRNALRWLDARTARYIERLSPMGFNFAAMEAVNEGESEASMSFDEVRQRAQMHQQEHRRTPSHPHSHGDGHERGNGQ